MSTARIWTEQVTIPTYPVGEPSPHPMYLDKRVYQGSSGVVYPHPVIDKVYDDKEDRQYHAIYMENDYLKIMLLPEIGGRVQMAYDKTNDYHFVYHNRVIKPALVGLAGPWISGGIEFNWPQHHRPSTFDPVDFAIEEREDGSVVAWIGEIERMFRTKSVMAATLYPHRAYLELNVTLYNRSETPQTFLWWANPAVAVHDETQTVFPPDVHAVMDHGKRDTSRFPIATGTYYKVDYSAGVDISRYRNIPVPTSYMAFHSDYDFLAGFDHRADAGIIHVADHHMAPGKKQWTWGNGEFGQAWDRNLTDEDGPYIELMAGVFTDNQPDFSWLLPFEEKRFSQYFMPYKSLGTISNASIHGAIHLSRPSPRRIRVGAYVTEPRNDLALELRRCGSAGDDAVWSAAMKLDPRAAFTADVDLDDDALYELRLSDNGTELLAYAEREAEERRLPDPARPIAPPEEIATVEELYLAGLHLEQYRHATVSPESYYREALRRAPNDIRCNNALGMRRFRQGLFAESERHYRRAIESQTRHNSNPYDGEVYYNLGLALKHQERFDEAYDVFSKSCWNQAWQSAGYYQVALIDCRRHDWSRAQQHLRASLVYNGHNQRARGILAAALRSSRDRSAAREQIDLALSLDPLDHLAAYELVVLTGSDASGFMRQTRGSINTLLEISLEYYWAGMFQEAVDLLELRVREEGADDTLQPLLPYYLFEYYKMAGMTELSQTWLRRAGTTNPGPCFPHFLETQAILERASGELPSARTSALLGHTYYAKGRHEEAIAAWETTRDLGASDPTVFRNLSLAYFNKRHDSANALESMERAFSVAPGDARILFELDLLKKKLHHTPADRIEFLERQPRDLIEFRDDLYTEFITLLNLVGRQDEALGLMLSHRFHPWEGGEGKISRQFVRASVVLARRVLADGDPDLALRHLASTDSYPHNLGEGKLYGHQESEVLYLKGLAHRTQLRDERAAEMFDAGSKGISEPASAMFYNDQPPEGIYYQGLCMRALGNEQAARSRFNRLIEYGERHQFDDVRIDYFAVSLPDFLVFDEDLNAKNRIHCRFMQALGHRGIGDTERAHDQLQRVLDEDPNHQGAIEIATEEMEPDRRS